MQSLLHVCTLLAATTASGEYRVVDVANGGSVAGTVRFTKPPPTPAPMPVHRDESVCGTQQPDERYAVGAGGEFANVVVFIQDIEAGRAIERKTVSIDQKSCRYVPHVSAFPVGTKLMVANSDPILHNTHTYIGERTLFNVALPMKGMKVPKRIKKTGIIRFSCDAGHDWMRAWAFVTGHPYVTVTDAAGAFEIGGIPAGEYTLATWHEVEGEKSTKFTVAPSGKTVVDFAY